MDGMINTYIEYIKAHEKDTDKPVIISAQSLWRLDKKYFENLMCDSDEPPIQI